MIRQPSKRWTPAAGHELIGLLEDMAANHQLIAAITAADISAVRDLFKAYAGEIAVDLCFQNFGCELASLPGEYAPPGGGLWLARSNGSPTGCIGLRRFSEGVAELKRLYVVPDQRRNGLGRLLVGAALAAARENGYRVVRLDTLGSMRPAIGLYESFGFQRVQPYYRNPLPDVLYFELSLSGPKRA